ncbi:MAG: DNA polymerase III subunit alpha [Acidobacteriota bacterium]
MPARYIELHTSSAFSFLAGSSAPEELIERAAELEYPAMALLDRDGVYGLPRFHLAARRAGIRALVGSQVPLQLFESTGPRPAPLALLVESPTGYQNLCRCITRMKLRSPKGAGSVTVEELAEFSAGLICLTGGSEGPLERQLQNAGMDAARVWLEQLQGVFGRDRVYIELQRHHDRRQEHTNQARVALARSLGLPLLATNGVRYARPQKRLLLDVLTCIHEKTTLDTAGRLLEKNAECYLKSPDQIRQLFADLPEAVHNSVDLADRLHFTLDNLGYSFPVYPVPPGETMNAFLRQQTWQGARDRYRPLTEKARRQIERELDLICRLDLAGYFLIVWDIVCFCRCQNILAQGRGSAANSAVCYSLGITAVDPVGMELLFERFLSEERGEWPDIDIDLPSGDRRERVIQYVYDRYGKHGAAMTANVITYRSRSAAREVGKSLGFPPAMLDRFCKLLSTWGYQGDAPTLAPRLREAGLDPEHPRLKTFAQIWQDIQDLPRHLGQHSGGMVVCQGRLDSVVPLENASMPGRVVVQWDKEDCADLGIIKVDLLGLGMLAALQDAIEMIQVRGGQFDLAHLPPDDPEVYAVLQQADTIGMFQVESRAQMASLPRMHPRCFYDLVVQVAIIRPGPIVGQMVNPYFSRRNGKEPVSYLHPSLEPILARTLGIPLFQEQLLRMAMTVAGFTGGQAEELRRAMGFKRSEKRMREIEIKLRAGMGAKGISGETADAIVRSITSFALYGFPESHAASFALLAYASAYLKVHFPAAFFAAIFNNQPMGFYHPAVLTRDAERHGQKIRPVDVQRSGWNCHIEEDGAVRMGLRYVAGLRQEAGQRLELERGKRKFQSLEDLLRRARLRRTEMVRLAEIGALNSLGLRRRAALWQVERLFRDPGPLFAGLPEDAAPAPLKDMTDQERLLSDLAGTGVSLGPHPMALLRSSLKKRGVLRAIDLPQLRNGRRVRVAGHVIARQRPGTAKGFFFISLEDETGISNAIFRPAFFEHNRPVLVTRSCLIIEGILQNQEGVISIRADRVAPIPDTAQIPSHDFH